MIGSAKSLFDGSSKQQSSTNRERANERHSRVGYGYGYNLSLDDSLSHPESSFPSHYQIDVPRLSSQMLIILSPSFFSLHPPILFLFLFGSFFFVALVQWPGSLHNRRFLDRTGFFLKIRVHTGGAYVSVTLAPSPLLWFSSQPVYYSESHVDIGL